MTSIAGVYEIRHAPTGRAYIGSSTSILDRWNAHRNELGRGSHHASAMQRLWAADGPSAFAFAVLEECDRSALLKREQFWLDYEKEPLNASRRVESGSLDPRVAAKISEALKGRRNPRVGEANRNRRGTPNPIRDKEAWRAKLSAVRKGRVFGRWTPERRDKISAALKGRTRSQEHCRNISLAKKAAFAARRQANATPCG